MEISPLRFSTAWDARVRLGPTAHDDSMFSLAFSRRVLAHLLRKLAVEGQRPNRVPNRSEAQRRAAMMIAATFLGIIGAIVVVTFLNRIP